MPVEKMPYVERYAEKVCTVCFNKYVPTGGNQTKCVECKDKKSAVELRAGVPDNPCLTTNFDQVHEAHTLHGTCKEILDSAEGVLSVTLNYDDLVVTISKVKEYS